MNMEKYPVFINGTKIIPQPNCCFVYSWQQRRFDIFNFESLIFFNEINGETSNQHIVDNLAFKYPNISLDLIENDLSKLQSFLEERGYLAINTFVSNNSDIFEYIDRLDEIKIVSADIEITKNCNLRCKYCFDEAGKKFPDLPLNQWIELLDSLYEKGLRFIKISGGEPFLYTEILELLEYAQKKFIVSLNTNGYFIDEDIVRKLSTMHLEAVQISLDSITPKVHDLLRGTGSWEKANYAVHLLHDVKVPIRISTTVTTRNYDELTDIRLLADELGAEISFEILKNNGRASTMEKEYFITDTEKVKQCSYESNIHRILDELEMACQAQLGAVGISYRGNIKPCNLTEDFFSQQQADVVVKFEKNWHYTSSPMLLNVNNASNKVINLLKDGSIKTKEKCIFEY